MAESMLLPNNYFKILPIFYLICSLVPRSIEKDRQKE